MSYSWKQKVMTKSLTEAELVGVDDALGYILWARYFMEEQGYDMDASILYQDYISPILLEKNGKASSSKRTKDIKVKYFYVKEKVDNGEIEIEHFPTEQMWTDINTKPKQGAMFRAFRGHVMGIPANYMDKDYEGRVHSTPPVSSMLRILKIPKASNECIGENANSSNNLTYDRPSGSDNVGEHNLDQAAGERNLDQAAGERNLDQALARDRPSESVVGQSKEDAPAPIKMVNGSPWSPNMYRNLRLIGMSLEEAWKKAFIRASHF